MNPSSTPPFLLLLSLMAPLNAAIIAVSDQHFDESYSINPSTGVATAITSGEFDGGGAAAYNPLTSTMYWSSGARLRVATGYTGGSLSPSSEVVFTYGQTSPTLHGLAFDTSNSKLVGTVYLGTSSTIFVEIDPSTGLSTLITSVEATFAGIDFDPLTGAFYGVNGAVVRLDGPGLYRIDDLYSNPTYHLLASLDQSTFPQGLATGNGMGFVLQPETLPLLAYNLASGSFVGQLANPIAYSGFYSMGGAYIPEEGHAAIPEPATLFMAGAALASLALFRRRRA